MYRRGWKNFESILYSSLFPAVSDETRYHTLHLKMLQWSGDPRGNRQALRAGVGGLDLLMPPGVALNHLLTSLLWLDPTPSL